MEINTLAQSGVFAPVTGFSNSLNSLSDKEKQEGFSDPGQKVAGNSDSLALSDEAVKKSSRGESEKKGSDSQQSAPRDPNQATSPTGEPLSEQELREIEQLKRRDAEVRTHEQAHKSAAGNLVQGGASFDYETGPDGNRYAVGGEVSIDTSRIADDPQATLMKVQKIRRAALAPVDPSSQDRSVAAEASRMEAQARVELSQQIREKQNEYIEEHTPEIDLFSVQINQNEKAIQDTYKRIQNTQVLEQQRIVVDLFT